MTEQLIIHLKIIGVVLISLSFIHVIFPSYFKWKDELKEMTDKVVGKYEEILKNAKEIASERKKVKELAEPVQEEDGSKIQETAISSETLQNNKRYKGIVIQKKRIAVASAVCILGT